MALETPKPIDVFSLGLSGVIIDPHPLMTDVPTDALTQAQNVSHDPMKGRGGALRKRPGFSKFNQINAGGVILGGCPMAVAGTGGAPEDGGGGDTGGGDGGGDGTGGGGGDFGGGGTGTGGDPGGTGGGAFGSNTGIIMGIDTNNTAGGYGWLVSPPKGTAAAAVTTSPYAPHMPQNTGFSTGIKGTPCCATDDGWFYFAKAQDTDSTGSSQTTLVYRTNGTVTQLVTTLTAFDGVNNKYPTVTAMCYAATPKKVYLALRDTLYNVTTAPAPQTRIYEIDHAALTVTLVGTIAGYTIMCMLWSETVQKLYMPACDVYNVTASSGVSLYYWSPANGYGSTILATTGIISNPFCMCIIEHVDASGAGYLRIGTLRSANGSGGVCEWVVYLSAAIIDGVSSMATTSDLGTGFAGHNAESMSNYAGLYSIAYFNGAFFHSWYNSGTKGAIVRELLVDASGSTAAMGTPSDVWTDSGVGSRMPFFLHVINGVLYAFGSTGLAGNKKILYTEDGTTWTDISTNFFTNNPATGYPLPTLVWHIDA